MRNLTTTDSNKAFEEACTLQGYDPIAILPEVSKLPEWLQKYTHSSIKRLIIAEAINEGKVRTPGKQRGYFPVWDLTDKTSGPGFSLSTYGGWTTHAIVGVRLEFFDIEDSDFFGSNFMDLHKDVLIVNPKISEE